ncbi:MAG: DNA-directed RNA polymerase subunit H [Candidatus Woesearchaeota archaeon]
MKTKVDIRKHILVPNHQKISAEEKQKLFDQYRVTVKEMPKIGKKDPTIKELSAKPGDIIKITRNSPTGGIFDFYRVVSDD